MLSSIRETATLVAFHHPHPTYSFHVLILPKKAFAGLGDLNASVADFLADLFRAVQSLVAEFNPEAKGYRLIVNGGNYQEIPQLHFHLISE